jgi:hypothetical protein
MAVGHVAFAVLVVRMLTQGAPGRPGPTLLAPVTTDEEVGE